MRTAELVADRLLLLASGHALAFGTLDELRAKAGLPGAPLDDAFLALLDAEAPMLRRELGVVLGARATWAVAALAALLVGHGFVLALDLYAATSRSALNAALMRRELDP